MTDPDQNLFALKLLELARMLEPEGNRVQFVRNCEKQGIRGFLQSYPQVWRQITDDPPREGITPDRDYLVSRAAFALRSAAWQEQLLRVLADHQIPALAIKGVSLSMTLYGDLGRREFGDVDLLIDPGDAPKACSVLNDFGLRPVRPPFIGPGQEAALYRYSKARVFCGKGQGEHLDLHWRLLSAWIGADLLPFHEAWERAQVLRREGLKTWRTLGPEDTLVFVALHGFQDGWPKLKQLLDLTIALQVLPYRWERVLELSRYRACLVERAVELAVRLFQIPHPGEMTHHYSDDQHALAAWLMMARASRTPQRSLLHPRLWSCSSEEALRRRLDALFTPALDDILSVDLPLPLVPLYRLVRAFRLIGKAVSRSKNPEE